MEEAVIIMSTYNGEKYLREQIDSILSQTGVNLNLVVRDDGSSDNTSGIIREYQRKYSNIHLMSSRNVGCKKSFTKLPNMHLRTSEIMNILHFPIRMMYGFLTK